MNVPREKIEPSSQKAPTPKKEAKPATTPQKETKPAEAPEKPAPPADQAPSSGPAEKPKQPRIDKIEVQDKAQMQKELDEHMKKLQNLLVTRGAQERVEREIKKQI